MSKSILPNPDEQHTSEAGPSADREDSPPAQTNRDTGDSRGLLDDSVGSPADPAPDPFDPKRLRLDQNFAAGVPVKRVITRVQCDKPHSQLFVRVRPGEEWRLETGVFTDKINSDKYLVEPRLWPELGNEVRPTCLFTAITKQGELILWPVPLPGSDGRSNPWWDTHLDAARNAETHWTKMIADQSAGYYHIEAAQGVWPDPEWPEELSFTDILRLAFKDRFISDINHPILRALRGER